LTKKKGKACPPDSVLEKRQSRGSTWGGKEKKKKEKKKTNWVGSPPDFSGCGIFGDLDFWGCELYCTPPTPPVNNCVSDQAGPGRARV